MGEVVDDDVDMIELVLLNILLLVIKNPLLSSCIREEFNVELNVELVVVTMEGIGVRKKGVEEALFVLLFLTLFLEPRLFFTPKCCNKKLDGRANSNAFCMSSSFFIFAISAPVFCLAASFLKCK